MEIAANPAEFRIRPGPRGRSSCSRSRRPRGPARPGRREAWARGQALLHADDQVVEFGPVGGRVAVEEEVKVRGRCLGAGRAGPAHAGGLWFPALSIRRPRRPLPAGRSRTPPAAVGDLDSSARPAQRYDRRVHVACLGDIRLDQVRPDGMDLYHLTQEKTWPCRSRGWSCRGTGRRRRRCRRQARARIRLMMRSCPAGRSPRRHPLPHLGEGRVEPA